MTSGAQLLDANGRNFRVVASAACLLATFASFGLAFASETAAKKTHSTVVLPHRSAGKLTQRMLQTPPLRSDLQSTMLAKSTIFTGCWRPPPLQKPGKRVVMLGLDRAGTTTVMFQWVLGRAIRTLPTIGCDLRIKDYKHFTFYFVDAGGLEPNRPIWEACYANFTEGLIYVVDSSDPYRLAEAKEELYKVLNSSQTQNVPLLVFANKQDKKNHMTTEQITDNLELSKVDNRPWLVQSANATECQGLWEGLDWLEAILAKRDGLQD
eukprot:gnl/TRDRNA2_/TRDRNA2_165726_c0_seq1.p1 gnl/TRDRNA2_/TRDRNA2_165726_c0~~gnl/TRDRNA2_/TRDRNA2_165726_c0_seq1.p1  ORF type:complete len:266 (+),score=40.68 gnl/TRDRNA2_/TRDRNA2_165726_c0_seq1:72-869(+)